MAVTSPSSAHGDFATAFNRGDLDALCDIYEPDALFVPEPGAEAVRGIDAIRTALAGFLAMKPHLEIKSVFVHVIDDICLQRADWSLTATGGDGRPVEMKGSSTEVLRRQADGSWRQIIDNPFGAN